MIWSGGWRPRRAATTVALPQAAWGCERDVARRFLRAHRWALGRKGEGAPAFGQAAHHHVHVRVRAIRPPSPHHTLICRLRMSVHLSIPIASHSLPLLAFSSTQARGLAAVPSPSRCCSSPSSPPTSRRAAATPSYSTACGYGPRAGRCRSGRCCGGCRDSKRCTSGRRFGSPAVALSRHVLAQRLHGNAWMERAFMPHRGAVSVRLQCGF